MSDVEQMWRSREGARVFNDLADSVRRNFGYVPLSLQIRVVRQLLSEIARYRDEVAERTAP